MGFNVNVDRRYKNSKNIILRKGEALAVQSVRNGIRRVRPSTFPPLPTVLVNSVPKSGTHLLTQIVEGLASNDDWGTFLNFLHLLTLHEAPIEDVHSQMKKLVPGETARGHLFWHKSLADLIEEKQIVSYFIYRDPRDVALAEARYLKTNHRLHRMHRVFRSLSPDDALMLAIKGWTESPDKKLYYPDIGTRYRRYTGWLTHEHTLAVRFEDLRGKDAESWTRRIVTHYVNASGHDERSADEMLSRAMESIDPTRSPTYRQGRVGGWRGEYTAGHRDAFHRLAGPLLIEMGYESDDGWV